MTIEPTGPGRFAHYRIQHQGRYWTGLDWAPEQGKALLYADSEAAGQDCGRLVDQIRVLEKVREFVLPLRVRVSQAWPVEVDALIKSLAERIQITWSDAAHPIADPAIDMLELRWDQVQEQPPEPEDQ